MEEATTSDHTLLSLNKFVENAKIFHDKTAYDQAVAKAEAEAEAEKQAAVEAQALQQAEKQYDEYKHIKHYLNTFEPQFTIQRPTPHNPYLVEKLLDQDYYVKEHKITQQVIDQYSVFVEQNEDIKFALTIVNNNTYTEDSFDEYLITEFTKTDDITVQKVRALLVLAQNRVAMSQEKYDKDRLKMLCSVLSTHPKTKNAFPKHYLEVFGELYKEDEPNAGDDPSGVVTDSDYDYDYDSSDDEEFQGINSLQENPNSLLRSPGDGGGHRKPHK